MAHCYAQNFSFTDIFPQTVKLRKRLWIYSLEPKNVEEIHRIQTSHLVISENQRLIEIAREKETIKNVPSAGEKQIGKIMVKSDDIIDVNCDRLEIFIASLDTLTQTESKIFEAYINRVNMKEIISTLGIKEETLKYHNKNIYNKLGVSSHKELLEKYKQVKDMKLECKEKH